MNKITISQIITFALLGEMIVPIIFKNLPFPFSTFYLYFLLWLGYIILLKPSIFFKPINRNILLFFLLYLYMYLQGIYNINDKVYNIHWLIYAELLPIFVTITLFEYYISTNNIQNLINIVKTIIIFFFITCLSSLIGLINHPNAARELTGILAQQENYKLINEYHKLGIAGYDFYYGLAFLLPTFILLLKIYWLDKNKKYPIIIFIVIALITIIKSQLTTSLIIALIGILFALIGSKKIKQTLLFIIITITTIIFIPKQFYVELIKYTVNYIPGETLQKRLQDISKAIQYKEKGLKDNETHISERQERFPILIANFYKSPIFGGGISTGHNFWLDRLSLFGLLGIIPWYYLLKCIIKTTINKINKEFIYFYMISIILFIALGFIKANGGPLVYLNIFFLIPSILIIYSYKKPN